MKLTTKICVYCNWDGKEVATHAKWLMDDIKAFAKMRNCAFWTEGSDKDATHCIVVRSFMGDIESGLYIENAQIEKTVLGWCNEVAAWCRDDPNEGDGEFEHKKMRVEICDLENEGGLQVICYDEKGEDMGIRVLPIYKPLEIESEAEDGE